MVGEMTSWASEPSCRKRKDEGMKHPAIADAVGMGRATGCSVRGEGGGLNRGSGLGTMMMVEVSDSGRLPETSLGTDGAGKCR
jgi:hypothetical protein